MTPRASLASSTPVGSVADDLERAIDVAAGRGPLSLADHLYANWWCGLRGTRPNPVVPPWASMTSPFQGAHALTAAFDAGWHVVEAGAGGTVLVARDRELRWLGPADVANVDRPGVPPQPGERVLATRRRDSSDPSTGYWYTWSQTSTIGLPLVRVYWNASPAAAVAIVRSLTASLPDSVPFQCKAPIDPRSYDRLDAAVLYLDRRCWAQAAPSIATAIAATAALVGDATLPMTKRLAPGVCLADDLGPDESYGSQRCRLIAEALTAREGANTTEQLGAIRAHLLANGVREDRPWLASDNDQEYEL